MSILIKNGHVIDPANNRDEVLDILIEWTKIKKVGKSLAVEADEIIDATGLVVTPGLIDMQVHFREPGREDKETIETWSRACLAWGITSVVTMPNTHPTVDWQSQVRYIINRSKELDLINVYPSWAITKKLEWNELSEMWEMKQSGVVAVTDDGHDVQDEWLLLRAMKYAKTHDMLLMSHCECEDLTEDGVMHEWWVSTQLGLPGTSDVTEDMSVWKNILLAEKSGCRFHLLHNSTKWAMDAIRIAKKEKKLTNISAEVSVQHFALTDEECFGYNTNAKMYPPLRSHDHVDAVVEAIREWLIDAFTTDHAPHTEPDKMKSFQDASFWSTWVETSFAVMNTYLVETGHIPLVEGIRMMTSGPARIIRIDKWTLSEWADADIALFDTKQEWIVNPEKSYSKGKNCIFNGKKLTGKAVYTLVGGRVKMKDGSIL